ncbi:MAG: hypothetical protein LBI81_00095, partial [Puniceicoccales bacterium]|nr:hypothetical protein [Puniceicoccales bacterium]
EDLAKLQKKCDVAIRLREFRSAFEALPLVNEASVEELIHKLAEKNDVNGGEYIHSVRFAVSGRSVGPGFFGLLKVLGKKTVLARLNNFLVGQGKV